MKSSALLLLVPLVLCSCWDMGERGDAKTPGDVLGTYQVSAVLKDSSCGPNALGSEDHWNFNVRLSRQGEDLYWLNGQEPIAGSIAADGGAFSFESRNRHQISASGQGRAGCAIWREDSATGTLNGSGLDVHGFSGELGFAYEPEANSDCSELIGIAGGFQELPCALTYTMTAARVSRE